MLEQFTPSPLEISGATISELQAARRSWFQTAQELGFLNAIETHIEEYGVERYESGFSRYVSLIETNRQTHKFTTASARYEEQYSYGGHCTVAISYAVILLDYGQHWATGLRVAYWEKTYHNPKLGRSKNWKPNPELQESERSLYLPGDWVAPFVEEYPKILANRRAAAIAAQEKERLDLLKKLTAYNEFQPIPIVLPVKQNAPSYA